MSTRNLFFAVWIATFAGVAMFSNKIRLVRDNQDEAEDALKDIRSVLLEQHSAAAYQDFGLDNEMRFRIKYALAPAYLCTANFLTARRYDTLLAAFPATVADSQRLSVLAGREVLLQSRDRDHIYVLTKIARR